MTAQNQFQLLKSKRFSPYFLTQLLGAFNDNIYKNALLTIIAFSALDQITRETLTNLGAMVFILPFFIFSAVAGQLADKYKKSSLIRAIKFVEILIMGTAVYAILNQDLNILLAILFLMGMQSAFFAPVKYSILPQYLNEYELVGGNGLVEMGTFVAILLGTIGGILLIRIPYGNIAVSICVVVIAILGFVAAYYIPTNRPAANTQLNINWNPITQTWRTLKRAASQRTVFLTILGISWFWFFGAMLITQLFNYNRDIVMGDEIIMAMMIGIASIGIGVGSLSCERLSGRHIEIGLVPFGAIFLTIFSIDFSFAHSTPPTNTITAIIFLQQWSGWHILIDLFFIGFFGGIYSVPLYVLLQSRTEESERSQMVAANSVMNALFMVAANLVAIGLFKLGLSIPQLILIVGLLNLAITFYIFKLVPEFLMRFVTWIVITIMYRVEVRGAENIPYDGGAVITCNHVSFVDPLIMAAFCRRPIRFVMDHRIFKIPVLSFVFKTAGCIPVAPASEDPKIKEQAFVDVKAGLQNDDLIGLFPEGAITRSGNIEPFRPGISRILRDSPVPIIPVAISGLWGSFFSRRYGKAMHHWPRQFLFKKVVLQIGKPIPAESFELNQLKIITEELLVKAGQT